VHPRVDPAQALNRHATADAAIADEGRARLLTRAPVERRLHGDIVQPRLRERVECSEAGGAQVLDAR